MELYNFKTQQIFTEQEFRASRNESLPAVLDQQTLFDRDFVAVLATPKPPVNWKQVAVRDGVEKDALQNWVQKWRVVDLSPDAIAAALDDAKKRKNSLINQWRLDANKTSFRYKSKTIACDALSRGDIDATNGEINNRNAMPVPWVGGWKAVDNTYVAINTVSEWRDFYSAMYQQGNTNFGYAQSLKTALAIASNIEQVEAIVW